MRKRLEKKQVILDKMKKIFSISTGFVYKFFNERNEMISKLSEYRPEGIELSFADPQFLFDFKITSSNLDYLRNLKYVSIHAPWKNVVYGNNEECYKILEQIEKLYIKIGAKNITVHVSEIDDFNVFKRYNFTLSIENDDWRKGANTIEKIRDILDKNPHLKFTFDFAHALTISNKDIQKYIELFKNKISQIHLSYLNKNLLDHYFLHKYDSSEMQSLLSNLKDINCPIILECVASKKEDLPLIRNEIQYLQKII